MKKNLSKNNYSVIAGCLLLLYFLYPLADRLLYELGILSNIGSGDSV